MARRRAFYARARNGQFARVAGSKGVYKRKSGRGRKIAIAGAGAVAVAAAGVAIYGAHEAGKSKGWDVGHKQGVVQASPLRVNGKFAKGKRPVAKNPYVSGTKIRAGKARTQRAVGHTIPGRKVKR